MSKHSLKFVIKEDKFNIKTIIYLFILIDLFLIPFGLWIILWYLDARYLQLEKCYRAQYDWLIQNRLKSDELLFDMNAKDRFLNEVPCVRQIMVSWSLLSFYGLILFLMVSVLALDYFGLF